MNFYLSGVVGAIIGVFIKSVFDKFRNRKNLLIYNVYHSSLGSTETHPLFGSIEILYNKNPMKNLFLSKLEISNNGYRDIDRFELNIACNNDSNIIISAGKIEGSLKMLEFTPEYIELLNSSNPVWLKRRDYIVPVFNRNDTIEVSMLTTNEKGERPYIYANIEKIGYSVVEGKNISRVLGEPLYLSAIIGIAISIILVLLVINMMGAEVIAPILSFIIGLFAQFFGIIFIKLIKLGIRILS